MAHLKAHEVLDAQEHVRSEQATSHLCRYLANQCNDPELRSFVENEVRVAEENARRLLGFLTAPAH